MGALGPIGIAGIASIRVGKTPRSIHARQSRSSLTHPPRNTNGPMPGHAPGHRLGHRRRSVAARGGLCAAAACCTSAGHDSTNQRDAGCSPAPRDALAIGRHRRRGRAAAVIVTRSAPQPYGHRTCRRRVDRTGESRGSGGLLWDRPPAADGRGRPQSPRTANAHRARPTQRVGLAGDRRQQGLYRPGRAARLLHHADRRLPSYRRNIGLPRARHLQREPHPRPRPEGHARMGFRLADRREGLASGP